MYLRSNHSNLYETDNYCNVLNITKAILAATSKIKYYVPIECMNQKKDIMCDNMKKLFEHSYVIPHDQYAYIVNILEKSVMNTLECNEIHISRFTKTITYINYELIPFIIVIFIFLYFLLKKYKIQ